MAEEGTNGSCRCGGRWEKLILRRVVREIVGEADGGR